MSPTKQLLEISRIHSCFVQCSILCFLMNGGDSTVKGVVQSKNAIKKWQEESQSFNLLHFSRGTTLGGG